MKWFGKWPLAVAALATTVFLVLSTAFSMAGVDLSIDTGNNAAKAILFLVLLVAGVAWGVVLLRLLWETGARLRSRSDT